MANRIALLSVSAFALLTGCKDDGGGDSNAAQTDPFTVQAAVEAATPAVASAPTVSAAPGDGQSLGGSPGNDTLTGGGGDDLIEGGGGNDLIVGGDGDDIILGDEGGLVVNDREEAARFLVQASFGANMEDIDAVEQMGFEAWVTAQMAMPRRSVTDRLLNDDSPNRSQLPRIFWEFATENDDQLRQRVSFALSQIIVISFNGSGFFSTPETYAVYMDLLQEHAFGNYTDLVREVSLDPAMGMWLTHLANRKADPAKGFSPDENYAREVMQLFTIGLLELNPDGTPRGEETYDNDDVRGLAAVFTGLSWANQTKFRTKIPADLESRISPMGGYAEYHEPAPKSFLTTTVTSADPLTSVDDALDHLLAHPNVAPFISKQLIQRLVTSNPSPAYTLRVANAFNTGLYALPSGTVIGEGRRGDMKATVAAILFEHEARDRAMMDDPSFGRVREPVLRFTQWARAFRDEWGGGPIPNVGNLSQAAQTGRLSQQPYMPPSVFNFYRPGYVAAGTQTAEAGLVAPELQITTSASVAGYINYMERVIDKGTFGDGFFVPDYTTELPMTEDPSALIDYLDSLLTYGTLSDATKARIEEAMLTINVDDNNTEGDQRKRLRIALLMIVTSPEYITQR